MNRGEGLFFVPNAAWLIYEKGIEFLTCQRKYTVIIGGKLGNSEAGFNLTGGFRYHGNPVFVYMMTWRRPPGSAQVGEREAIIRWSIDERAVVFNRFMNLSARVGGNGKVRVGVMRVGAGSRGTGLYEGWGKEGLVEGRGGGGWWVLRWPRSHLRSLGCRFSGAVSRRVQWPNAGVSFSPDGREVLKRELMLFSSQRSLTGVGVWWSLV